jgi:hypothetical protein
MGKKHIQASDEEHNPGRALSGADHNSIGGGPAVMLASAARTADMPPGPVTRLTISRSGQRAAERS